MRESWANESKLECDLRRAGDRQSKSRKRANKTEQETVERRASDRQGKAKRRVKLSKRLLSVELVKGSVRLKEEQMRLSKRLLSVIANDRQCKAKRRTNETEQETVELVSRASPLFPSIRLLSCRNVISYATFGLCLCDREIISRCSAAPRQSGHANRDFTMPLRCRLTHQDA